MSYSNILVAVAVTPESQQLLAKAVSIARPVKGHISLITLASDPEMYNQLAAPMLEDLRSVMQEETQSFLDKLIQDAGYPVDKTFIAYGELSEHILEVIAAACQYPTLANAVCIELFRQRFANPIINFQAKASVILTTLALLMPGAQCQKRHWRIGHLGRNSMRVFLALIFTKQPDFIAIILFIHQACAKLRPGG